MPISRKIIAVIVAFNANIGQIHIAINSLKNQIHGVIISDNSPNPKIRKSLRALEKEYPQFVAYIDNQENMGIGAALNIGAKEAIRRGANWIMTLDDDNTPESNMVKKMFDAYDSLPLVEREKIASIAPNYTRLQGFAFPDDEPHYIDGAITGGEIVKASVYPIVGWYNEYLFIDFVDGEFSCRVWQNGMKTLLIPKAILKHRLGFPTIKKILWKTVRIPNYPPYRYYFMIRNAWYLYVRNFRTYILNNNRRLDAIWSIFIPRFLIKAILFEDNKGHKIHLAWKGFLDGICGKMDRAYARERAGLPNVN